MTKRAVFLAWTRFQWRQLSMASHFGFSVRFFPLAFRWRVLKLIEYLVKTAQTLAYCARERLDEIWVQMPPEPLLRVAQFYRFLRGGRVRIIADCHNSMFDPPWRNWPGAVSALNRCDLVLVHNEEMVLVARNMGIRPQLIEILECAPTQFTSEDMPAPRDLRSPWILFPASFSADEPIDELVKAAAIAEEIMFVVTGNAETALRRFDLSRMPSNVRLTGYLPRSEFEGLLKNAGAVLGLTRYEGVQLQMCSEAVGAAKPMVLSDTAILRKLFGRTAVMVDSASPESIARGCREAISRLNEMTRNAKSFRKERQDEWEKGQASTVKLRLKT